MQVELRLLMVVSGSQSKDDVDRDAVGDEDDVSLEDGDGKHSLPRF